jgi:hypothetical protein
MSVKKLANKNAYANNMMIAHQAPLGCPCDGLTTCLYRFYSAVMASISSISYLEDGVVNTKAITVNNTSQRTKEASVEAAILSAGYDPHYEDQFAGVQIVNSNTLIIIGDMEVTSVTINGVAVAAVKTCTKGKVCKCTFSVEAADVVAISFRGETAFNYTAPAANSAATALTNLKAAFVTNDVINHGVIVSESEGVYTFTVDLEGDCADLTVAGISPITQSCKPYFVGLDLPGTLEAPAEIVADEDEPVAKKKK